MVGGLLTGFITYASEKYRDRREADREGKHRRETARQAARVVDAELEQAEISAKSAVERKEWGLTKSIQSTSARGLNTGQCWRVNCRWITGALSRAVSNSSRGQQRLCNCIKTPSHPKRHSGICSASAHVKGRPKTYPFRDSADHEGESVSRKATAGRFAEVKPAFRRVLRA